MKPRAITSTCGRSGTSPISVKADLRSAQVKAANAAGRNQNRRLLRGFTV